MHMDRKTKQVLVNHVRITLFIGLITNCGSALAVDYTGTEYRDPFRSFDGGYAAASQTAAPADYKLQGILWNPSDPQAIVNGVVVKIGQRVDGGEVMAIDRKKVKLLVNGEERYLSMEKRP